MGRYPFAAPNSTYIAYITPSGDTTGVTDAATLNNALAATPSTGGLVLMAATAPWYIKCGIVSINKSGVYIDATGCFINATGAGDMIRMFDSTSLITGRQVWGGGILGMPVCDGTNTTGNSTAFHGGDITQLAVFMQAQHWTAGTTSKGVWLDNNYFWTEQCYGRVVAQFCATGVQFDNSANTSGSATGSFDRLSIDIFLNTQGSGDGVTWSGGAFAINYYLGIWGNFKWSGTAYTALRMTGGNAGGASSLGVGGGDGGRGLFIGLEVDGTGSIQPTTIQFGASPFTFINSMGNISFSGFAASNNSAGHFQFLGPVVGDTTLQAVQGLTNPSNGQTIAADGATIFNQWYGVVKLTMAASHIGAIMQAGSYDNQILTVRNPTANTLTFAAAVTSKVADGVSDIIAANTDATYRWDAGNSLWYRSV